MSVKFILDSNRNHYSTRVVVSVLAGILLGAAIMAWGIVPLTTVDTSEDVTSEIQTVESTTEGELMSESEPVRLRIPSADIDTGFEGALGLDDTGAIKVPKSYEAVGWYQYGPTPGELGPAVVIGHVDSFQGPAVFYSLGRAQVGDEVYIDRADGSTAIFTVTEYERPLQSEFPTKKVYGDLNYAGLRLITCTGTYDHGIQRYSNNLIVYAKLDRVEN